MEDMERLEGLFNSIYSGKKVLITGHTGFKGSWLALWLKMMGADVYGYSLESLTNINHISLLDLEMEEEIADIRNLEKFNSFIERTKPDIVFHLAAQALVRESYLNPIETYSTNVMGTLNVFEACRKADSVRAIVNVTSDKCYENKEWIWGYRENDSMGGYDPYSSSKGMSELLTASYRNSFFNTSEYGKKHSILLGSGRAGNVIGGGDWAKDRLIPDIVKSAAKNQPVTIRNPLATRPWQHVLEPLSGYLMLGWKLLEGKKDFASGWNFGPDLHSNLSVGEITQLAKKEWADIATKENSDISEHHEANLLMLDCSKANKILKWNSVWNIDKTIQKTINWYKDFYLEKRVNTHNDINNFVVDARKKGLEWTK